MGDRGALRPIRVLLVDDHQIVLRGLQLTLTQDPAIVVVGSAATAAAALELGVAAEYDVAVVDMGLPDQPGSEVVEALRAARPGTAAIILSGDASEETQLAAIEAGAAGYLVKTEGASAIVSAVKRVARGEILFEAATLSRLFAQRRAQAAAEAGRPSLTGREAEVLDLLATGADTKEIAYQLKIGEHTVRRHTQNLLGKLDAHSRLEAVARARGLGLLKG